MQEINLLRNQLKDTTAAWQKYHKIIVTTFAVVLIVEIGLIIVFAIINSHLQRRVSSVKTENAQLQTNLDSKKNQVEDAVSFQAQLKNLRQVVDNHVYFSPFFEELAKYTFNKAYYITLTADTNGKVHLEGIVGNYSDLGKLLLGLNSSDKFTQVKLLSATPSVGQLSGFLFTLDLTVNKDLFYNK